MELLRIVAMLLVMVVHANFRALPKPNAAAIAVYPSSAFLQFLTEGFSIVAIDVFVMLSGWYGIRLRLSRLQELLFQIIFFSLLCTGVFYLVEGHWPYHAIKSLLMLDQSDYWFVKCYLGMYLVAPVLNAFVESATRRQFELLLIAFFGFQFVFDWLFNSTTWLLSGYSMPSFCILYLLARYLRVYHPRLTQFRQHTDLLIYLGVVAFLTIVVFVLRWRFNIGGIFYFYNCPFVILGATYLLLFFSKLKFKSRAVNWVAISSLAIYLTHSNTHLATYYDGTIRQWFYGESRPAFLLYATLLIIGVFTASILIDKVRLGLWNLIRTITHL